MVGHEIEGVHPVAETVDAFLQEQQEPVAIGVRKKDVLNTVAAQDDVIQATGKMDAGFAFYEAFIFSLDDLVNF